MLYKDVDHDEYGITQSEYCYPNVSVQSNGVPDRIKDAFDVALKVKNIDSAICLLSFRRVLEAICKDIGA